MPIWNSKMAPTELVEPIKVPLWEGPYMKQLMEHRKRSHLTCIINSRNKQRTERVYMLQTPYSRPDHVETFCSASVSLRTASSCSGVEDGCPATEMSQSQTLLMA